MPVIVVCGLIPSKNDRFGRNLFRKVTDGTGCPHRDLLVVEVALALGARHDRARSGAGRRPGLGERDPGARDEDEARAQDAADGSHARLLLDGEFGQEEETAASILQMLTVRREQRLQTG